MEVRTRMRIRLAAGSAVALSLVVAATVAAQSPSAAPTIGDITNVPHPAHIHTGSCANLGDVVAPLNDVTLVAGSDRVGVSQTKVDLSIKDMLESPHAIMSHASAENIGTYIACADLTGDDSADQLVAALSEQNASGYAGVAFLRKDGGKTEVDLSLTAPAAGFTPSGSPAPGETMAPMSMAPASASPEGSAAAGQAVTIQDFKFSPDAITVPVGATVTWTNADSTQHTVTADDGSFDSGPLDSGATFSQTFATAGTFTYHCNIHSNMTATVTVQ
jgi:plastocyanin